VAFDPVKLGLSASDSTTMASGWDEFAAAAQLALERQQIVGQSLTESHSPSPSKMLMT